VEVLDITLLPIGGLARMATIPRDPRQEFWIAVGGPTVNFVLAPCFYALHLAVEAGGAIPQVVMGPGHVLGKLAWLNLTLGGFNLLPAFPMDGGRILRAALAVRMPYVEATRIAAQLGQILAFLMGFFGLVAVQSPILVLIALFIFIGAGAEGERVQAQVFTEGVPVRDAMVTRFFTLSRADSLGRAAELLLEGTQHDFPVADDGRVVGILTRRRLLQSLEKMGRDRYVSEVMEAAPEPASPDEALADVLERMAASGQTVVPVESAQGLCGLVTTDNTAEYVLVRAALVRSREGQRGSRESGTG
jgi:CBS domain-containing protein